MNALNEHGNVLSLRLVAECPTTDRQKIARNDLADLDVIATSDFNDSEITWLDLNNEESALRIYENYGTVHRVTSNVK